MCGQEETEKTFLYCRYGHRLHRECLKALIGSTYPNPPPCPLCRDQSICPVEMSVMPDLLYMAATPFSQTTAVVAMMIGDKDYRTFYPGGLRKIRN